MYCCFRICGQKFKESLNFLLRVAEFLYSVNLVIRSFKHKGLEKFFTTGNAAGIQSAHALRISDRLAFLHAAKNIGDIDRPGYRLHPLKGDRSGFWAINVSGNWRIVFKFEDNDAYIVDYEDYH